MSEAATQSIMLVDDEPNILNALRRTLRPIGAQFSVFESPADALDALAGSEPDLIISDMRMPGMDGAEFLSRAKALHPHTLRILLTGYSDYDRAMSAVNEGGIWRHLSKPWNDAELGACVRQALHMRSIVAEKRRLEEVTRAQRDELKLLNQSLEAKVRDRTRQLSEANTKLGSNFSTLVKVLSGIVDARFSGGRTHRIAEVARRAAAQLNLAAVDCERIHRAALLHPIGRIQFPDELLATPPTELTAEQSRLWRSYPVNGEEMLMSLQDLSFESSMIRSHCERFDGTGFPDRYAGESIAIGARIIAAAIAFDELLGAGSMDDAKALAHAAHDLKLQAGKRLCPRASDAILAALCIAGPATAKAAEPDERHLDGHALQAGMQLSRDVIAPSGTLLLAAGQQLTPAIITQLLNFQERHGKTLRLWIATASIAGTATPH